MFPVQDILALILDLHVLNKFIQILLCRSCSSPTNVLITVKSIWQMLGKNWQEKKSIYRWDWKCKGEQLGSYRECHEGVTAQEAVSSWDPWPSDPQSLHLQPDPTYKPPIKSSLYDLIHLSITSFKFKPQLDWKAWSRGTLPVQLCRVFPRSAGNDSLDPLLNLSGRFSVRNKGKKSVIDLQLLNWHLENLRPSMWQQSAYVTLSSECQVILLYLSNLFTESRHLLHELW